MEAGTCSILEGGTEQPSLIVEPHLKEVCFLPRLAGNSEEGRLAVMMIGKTGRTAAWERQRKAASLLTCQCILLSIWRMREGGAWDGRNLPTFCSLYKDDTILCKLKHGTCTATCKEKAGLSLSSAAAPAFYA